MITTPTVLILGAGASMHLGYPSGIQLKTEILEILNNNYLPENVLIRKLEPHDSKIKEFSNALSHSGKASVDAFLEYRDDFMHLGKLVIALALTKYENLENLFLPDNNWYDYLYAKLDSPINEFDSNNLSIITFNYDRSLETYLHTALMNTYRLSIEDAKEILLKIPIIHVYGKLGELDWQSHDGRPYSSTDEIIFIKQAANGIKVIHEEVPSDTTLKDARSILVKTERIIFLGFGYGSTNLQRLGFNNDFKYPGKLIYGTCYGYTELERDHLKKQFEPGEVYLGHPLDKIGEFLREELVL
jgi:hypothetical protein